MGEGPSPLRDAVELWWSGCEPPARILANRQDMLHEAAVADIRGKAHASGVMRAKETN